MKPCNDGLVCNVTDAVTPLCSLPIPLGSDCRLGMCEKGAHCDGYSGKCAVNSKAGERCGSVIGNECGEWPLDLENGLSCINNVCVDNTKEGAPCQVRCGGCSNPCLGGLTCRQKKYLRTVVTDPIAVGVNAVAMAYVMSRDSA